MKEIDMTSDEGFKRRVERYIPKQGIINYAFICTTKKYVTTLHYLEEQKKTIHCFEGQCCHDGHRTNTYTIYLIGVYSDYKDPKAPLNFQYIRATRAVDEAIRALAEQFEDEKDLCNLDLQLFLDESVGIQYKKLGITPCINGKRKATKEQLLALKEVIERVKPYLETEIADVISPEEYAKMMLSRAPAKPIPKQHAEKSVVPMSVPVEAEPEEVTTEVDIDFTDLDELL